MNAERIKISYYAGSNFFVLDSMSGLRTQVFFDGGKSHKVTCLVRDLFTGISIDNYPEHTLVVLKAAEEMRFHIGGCTFYVEHKNRRWLVTRIFGL